MTLAGASPSGGPSTWEAMPMAPPDPVLGVSDAYRKCTDPEKMNLGVGAYRTEEGQPLVLSSVRKAEALVVADPHGNKEYQPITGNARFCALSRELAFGKDHVVLREKRVGTTQALSGTGSLRVGADYLKTHYPGPKAIYIPRPTWPTHKQVFAAASLELRRYRYLEPSSRSLDFDGMIEDLSNAEEGTIVLLHACAHNPTGVDPTDEQWQAILDVVVKKKLFPFFDLAYQGFASGDLDRDAYSLRLFANHPGMEMMLAQSYAKNMGLYGERIGALSVLASTADGAARCESQMGMVIRPMWSSPPLHGARIVQKVLEDPELTAEWKVELKSMADRIADMRKALHAALVERGVPGDWSFITRQIGMFSYTGLTYEQCQYLMLKWHVFLTADGRISMAGIRSTTVNRLADAIVDALLATDNILHDAPVSFIQPPPNLRGLSQFSKT